MKRFLVNASGQANITFYVILARDIAEAKRVLKDRFKTASVDHYNFQDITDIDFLQVIDIDKQDYDG